jgi:urea carboxylase
VVDVPVLFEDPWTYEAIMRFRDRHQDPNSTDLEYAARINGYSSKEDFIQAITSYPFLVSMVGFVPGLPFCFQMGPRERQIEDFQSSIVFPRQGDIFRFRSITIEEFENIRKAVENKTFKYLTQEIIYTPMDVIEDPKKFSEEVMRRLYHD